MTFAASGPKEGIVIEERDPWVAKGVSVMDHLDFQFGVRSGCERSRPGDKNIRQWLKVEHYRLHCVEEWPDSPYKEAVLAAARSALEQLEAGAIEPLDAPACSVCETRRAQARRVIMFPSRPQAPHVIMKPAA